LAASIDRLLAVESVRQIRESNVPWHRGLSVVDAQKLTRHLSDLDEAGGARGTLKLGVIHTYTSDLLNPWLNLHAVVQGLALQTYHAPYGLNVMEAQAGSDLHGFAPDILLLMLTQEDLHPAFSRPAAQLGSAERRQLADEAVDRLLGILQQFRGVLSGHILVSLLPALRGAGLGQFDRQSERSERSFWDGLHAQLAQQIGHCLPATQLLDMQAMLEDVGRSQFFDLRLWYSSRFPFSPLAANEFSRHLIDIGRLLNSPRAKVLVLDADNTLWGGIVGEDGPDGIRLGPDYPGNAFVDFQRRLLDFQQRGFLLALCSKNNPEDVQQILDEHPHQLLRDEHFAARRVNWQSKVQNIRELAEELNLGLDSFIFVDDSAIECGMVRQELPQVEVIQTPPKPVQVLGCLEGVARLGILSLTAEDFAKTGMYRQDRQRREQQARVTDQGGGIEQYLASLEMRMALAFNDTSQLARLAQLTQKTNQFNLTSRRYTEQQVNAFIESDNWLVASFSLADVFGDSGVVGLALVHQLDARRAEIDTLLMSCRVIGRNAESAFLEALLRRLNQLGIVEVSARYIPTRKNKLVEHFYPQHGFTAQGDNVFNRDLGDKPPAPESSFPITISVK
jgi:FkbH-like protein